MNVSRWLLAWTLSFASVAYAEAPPPSPFDPLVAYSVRAILERQHYEPVVVDDSVSAKWFDLFLADLDPARRLFLAGQVNAFKARAPTFDNALAEGDTTLPHDIYAAWEGRRRAWFAWSLDRLTRPFEDQSPLVYDLDRKTDPWPATDDEAKALWELSLREDYVELRLDGKDDAGARELLTKRLKNFQQDLDETESVDVLEWWLSAVTRTVDPHSIYFKPATNANFDIEISNAVEGIGATLKRDGDYITIDALTPGGPAALSGLLTVGDRIVTVGQGDAEPVDVVGWRIDKAVKLIRGKKGTEVRLTLLPPEGAETRQVSIIRDRVVLAESRAQSKIIEVQGASGPTKIGVIDLPGFYFDDQTRRGCSDDVRDLMGALQNDGAQALILDLRENGGGSLAEAIKLSGLFVTKGPMVQVRDRDGHTEALTDPDPKLSWSKPVVVLTSPLSASASEIVAGALQDYGRGVVVGSTTTHGKGTVQTIFDLDRYLAMLAGGKPPADVGGALKLTIQKFYRVTGSSTQVRGVNSDITVPSPFDGLEVYESNLEHALPWDEIEPARGYKPVGDLSPLITQLKARSADRVAKSADLEVYRKLIAERKAWDSRQTISLDLPTREKEKADAAARVPELPKDKDPVLDEALQISRDLVELSTVASR